MKTLFISILDDLNADGEQTDDGWRSATNTVFLISLSLPFWNERPPTRTVITSVSNMTALRLSSLISRPLGTSVIWPQLTSSFAETRTTSCCHISSNHPSLPISLYASQIPCLYPVLLNHRYHVFLPPSPTHAHTMYSQDWLSLPFT